MSIGPVILCLFFGLFGHARAQPLGESVLVQVDLGASSPEPRVVEAVERYLRERSAPVISMHDGRDRLLQLSAQAGHATKQLSEDVARGAEQALEHVAFGRRAAAEKAARQVLSAADEVLESLNRDTASARHLLDACLALVRLDLQAGRRDAALRQSMICRSLVPDLAASPNVHPSTVIGALAETDNLLRRMQTGGLKVQSASQQQTGCAVYVNGRHLGTTPLDLQGLPASRYRVQVECGNEVGRVHFVALGDEPSALLVDASFDRALSAEPRLKLLYEPPVSPSTEVSHAVELGRTIEADDVFLLELRGSDLTLTRVQVRNARAVARQTAAIAGPDGGADAIRQIVERVLAGRFDESDLDPSASASSHQTVAAQEVTGALTEMSPTKEPPPSIPQPLRRSSASRYPTVRSLIGPALLMTLGVASYAAAIVSNGLEREAGIELRRTEVTDPSYTFRLQRWQDTRPKLYAFGVAGVVLVDSAAVWLATSTPELPNWSAWVTGAAGLGLAAWGLSDVIRGEHCAGELETRKYCSGLQERRDRGGLALMGASAFFTFSISIAAGRMFRRSSYQGWSLQPDLDIKRSSFAVRTVLTWS